MKTALAAFALGLVASAGTTQDLSRLLSPDAKVTATLAGTLHGTGGRGSLDGITIVLSTFGNVPVHETTTNIEGQYLFEHIRPGAYIVLIKRADHLTELGRVRLLAGEKVTRNYTKGVVIAGTVADERGTPVPAVTVCLLRRTSEAGQLRFTRASSATTNARGQFVVGEHDHLENGAYLAAVMPAGCGAIASPDLVTPRLARYPPLYFPDVTSARDAEVVTLDARDDRRLAFRLRPGPTTRLEGRIGGYVNTSVVPKQIILEPPQGEPVSIVRATRIKPDGSFVFAGLVPGEYRLILAPQKGPDEPRWAVRNVTVRGETIARVPIVSQPTVAIGGRVDFASHIAALYGTRIFLSVDAQRIGDRPATAAFLPGHFAQVDADGRFGLAGIMPGAYQITVAGAEVVGWKLKSVMVPAADKRLPPTDAVDIPLVLEPNQSVFGLVVYMTYRATTVTGRIEDPAGQPAGKAFAVLFAPDARYWTRSSRRIRYVAADETGAFSVEGLPDGEYLAVAVRALPNWPDPAWFESMRTAAAPFRLGDGETRQLTLRLPAATDLPQ